MSDDSGRSSDLILAFGIGLLAGVAAGILLAPTSGAVTRRKIGRLAEEVGHRTRDMAEKTGEFVKEQTRRVGDAVHEGRKAL